MAKTVRWQRPFARVLFEIEHVNDDSGGEIKGDGQYRIRHIVSQMYMVRHTRSMSACANTHARTHGARMHARTHVRAFAHTCTRARTHAPHC